MAVLYRNEVSVQFNSIGSNGKLKYVVKFCYLVNTFGARRCVEEEASRTRECVDQV